MLLYYLWIALGGAIGSVARGWVSLSMSQATGPAFPWGTILINITGSLLIGFFATGTAGGGRWALSDDARTFLMVGICGGFTTFSSFSLQSLELLRQGRVGWALINMGGSVILCLGSVAAGYYIGLASRPTLIAPVSMTGTPTERAGKVVAVLDDPAMVPAMLDASARLADLCGAGRVDALAIEPRSPGPIMPSEEVANAEQSERGRAARLAWAGDLEQAVATWVAGNNHSQVQWLNVQGNVDAAIRTVGKGAVSVVVAARGHAPFGQAQQDLHSALHATGTSVLVIPPGYSGSFGSSIAVAWRPGERDDRAIDGAMPILQRAEIVHVLEVDVANPAMPKVLIGLGTKATVAPVSSNGNKTGQALLASVHRLAADMIVMGAYSNGEWKESLLGGVTKYMLENADVPVLMRRA